MSTATVPWTCTVGRVVDMPDRWVCVPEGAEELMGSGEDEDDAADDMQSHFAHQVLH